MKAAEMKAPSTNIQAPVKLQLSNSKRRLNDALHPWCLKIGASLELGCWCLEFRRLCSVAVLLLLVVPSLRAASTEKRTAATWEHSIVTIEVARKQYDYYQPWSRQMRRLQKVGTVVGEKQIL